LRTELLGLFEEYGRSITLKTSRSIQCALRAGGFRRREDVHLTNVGECEDGDPGKEDKVKEIYIVYVGSSKTASRQGR